MKVDHLIIGVSDLTTSAAFYKAVLDFEFEAGFEDTGTGKAGKVLVSRDTAGAEQLELLLVPFEPVRLPNPQHLALEVSATAFKRILLAAEHCGLPIRAEPSLQSTLTGPGEHESRGRRYSRFYLLDPNGTNLEILLRVDAPERQK